MHLLSLLLFRTKFCASSAKNDGVDAGMAAEMYDNTEAEIRAAISYSMLNLLFSTKDMVGSTTYMCY